MNVSIFKLAPNVRKDFYKVHCKDNGLDWCQCVAWWCSSWKEFANRKAQENKIQRDSLFDQGIYDGYVLYEKGRPIGSMQVGQRDRLKKLCEQYDSRPNPKVWAITCFAISPHFRGQGYAQEFLKLALEDLKRAGNHLIQAYPIIGTNDPWTGPISLYKNAGFKTIREDEKCPILQRNLTGTL